MNKLLVVFLLLLSFELRSETLKFYPYQDQFKGDHFISLGLPGELHYLGRLTGTQEVTQFHHVDEECVGPYYSYAYPFLVNPETTCKVDIEKGEIELLSRDVAPKDSFSIRFLFSSKAGHVFILNNREFPNAKFGSVYLKIVSETGVTFKEIMTEVPGYSGAIDYFNGKIFMALSSGNSQNIIFSFPIDTVKELLKRNASMKFSAVAKKETERFVGLSYGLIVNGDQYLLHNKTPYGEYESYIINLQGGARTVLSLTAGCQPLRLNSNSLLEFCGNGKLNNLTLP